MSVDKSEYWDFIKLLKSQARPLVNIPKPLDIQHDPEHIKKLGITRLYHAVAMVKSGMSKRKAARLAHVGESRLRRTLEELDP